jgi:hypothetical protein
MRFTHKDLKALQQAILELHGCKSMVSCRRAAPGILIESSLSPLFLRVQKPYPEGQCRQIPFPSSTQAIGLLPRGSTLVGASVRQRCALPAAGRRD